MVIGVRGVLLFVWFKVCADLVDKDLKVGIGLFC